MDRWEAFIRIFSKDIRIILKRTAVNFKQVQELRLRVQAPLLIIWNNQEYYITPEGTFSRQRQEAYLVTKQDVKETLEYVSSHSLYAYEEEIRQGFITIPGGHRIGLAGKTVADERGIRSMKFISFINVRLAHEVCGCGNLVIPYLYDKGNILHTLIISPPRCGKTTLLRDLIRQVSDGAGGNGGMTVGVVDERSELGACCQGVPQNNLGIRTDILDCCPKVQGMMMLIRTRSPQVVAVDEIGSRADLEAMEQVMNCGCKLMATVHGSSIQDIRQKPVLKQMMAERWFERYVVLEQGCTAGRVEGIYNAAGEKLYPKQHSERKQERNQEQDRE